MYLKTLLFAEIHKRYRHTVYKAHKYSADYKKHADRYGTKYAYCSEDHNKQQRNKYLHDKFTPFKYRKSSRQSRSPFAPAVYNTVQKLSQRHGYTYQKKRRCYFAHTASSLQILILGCVER